MDEFISKGENLIRKHRQMIFEGTEVQQDRHTRAIIRLKKVLETPWRDSRPYRDNVHLRVISI